MGCNRERLALNLRRVEWQDLPVVLPGLRQRFNKAGAAGPKSLPYAVGDVI